MKLGIIGYGRMGRMIEQVALQRGHEIVSVIDLDRPDRIGEGVVDCYIDFSLPSAVRKTMEVLCEHKVPVVTGVTGWYDELLLYKDLFERSGNKGIWSGNFSLGVNLYWQALAQVTSVFDKFAKEYDVMVHEFHHKNKLDSPSGTALQIAEVILANSTAKTEVVTEALQRKREDNELHVSSTRGGAVPGTHTVLFDSAFDTVEFTHTARTREGFALGSVVAAENIGKLPVGLFKFSDVFSSIFEG